jgi:murein DD-endopeptidase MepM/ murein hydrolase activator NlpD
MTAKLSTDELLAVLDELDVREGDVVAALLARAAELRRHRALTAADLAGLGQSLTGLVTVVGGVQQAIALAGSAAPPALDALQAQLSANAAEFDRLRAELRAGIVALEGETGGGSHGTPDQGGRTFRLVRNHMKGTDVAHFQRDLNLRLARWGVHKRIAESGEYDAQTRLAAHQVAYGLGIETAAFKEGITPAVRALVHAPSHRTPDQITRAHMRRGWLVALRKRFAHATHKAKAGSSHHAASHNGTPAHNGASHKAVAHKTVAHTDAGLAAAIRAHGGRYEDIIIAEARRSRVPVSLVCAVIDAESSFTNVFGHDHVRNPIKSVDGRPNLVVTEALYKAYVHHRDNGEECQGVGPMQLTAKFLQDRADALGGCYKPGPNIRTGVERLGALIKQRGSMHGALVGYNGSTAYADAVIKLQRVWHARLEGHASGHAAGGHAGNANGSHAAKGGHAHAPGKPRTLRMTEPELMAGSDVKAFQQLLNHRLAAWGIGERVAEDGVYGIDTRHAAHQVALGLGLAPAEYAKGMTPAVRELMRAPSRRTPEQLKRAASRRAWLAKLRKSTTGAKGAKGAKIASGRYPLAVRGTFLGGPGVGTHSFTAPPNNWQSDNAVDLGTPIGTAMIAVDSGRVVKVSPHAQDGSRFAGDAITIVGDSGNSFFYKHGVSSVKVGERVHKGQKIGTSGSASGSAHLHFGVKHGNPLDLIGQHS